MGLWKSAEGGRLAVLNGVDEVGYERENVWQVVDDRGIGEIACWGHCTHPLCPVGDNLSVSISEELTKTGTRRFEARGSACHLIPCSLNRMHLQEI